MGGGFWGARFDLSAAANRMEIEQEQMDRAEELEIMNDKGEETMNCPQCTRSRQIYVVETTRTY